MPDFDDFDQLVEQGKKDDEAKGIKAGKPTCQVGEEACASCGA